VFAELSSPLVPGSTDERVFAWRERIVIGLIGFGDDSNSAATPVAPTPSIDIRPQRKSG
jgi:hypothetical protein